VDHRCQDDVEGSIERCLSAQVAAASALRVSETNSGDAITKQASSILSMDRLHGTWIPGAHLELQRDLDHLITPQPSLVHKIMASRFRHFVDIFAARPKSRSRSLTERLAFWVLFLMSWVVLGQVALDVRNDHEMRHSAVAWLSMQKSSLTRYLEPVSGLQVSAGTAPLGIS
jgi:hypothetical protein